MNEEAKHNWVVAGLMYFTDGLIWMARQLADPDVRRSVYFDLGLPVPKDDAQAPDIQGHVDSISGYIQTQDPTGEQIRAVLEELRAIYQALRDFIVQNDENGKAAGADALFRLMSTNYIRLRAPLAYWLFQPLLFADDALSNGILPSNTLAAGKSLLHNIADLILHSKDFFKRVSLQTAADAQTISDYTFLSLVNALGILATFLIKGNWFKQSDIQILYGWEPDPNPPPGPNDPNPDKIPNTPNADQISSRMLSVSFANSQPNTQDEMP